MYPAPYALLAAFVGSALAMSDQSPAIFPRSNHPFPANLDLTVWSEPGCNQTGSVSRVTTFNEKTLAYSDMWDVGLMTQSYMLSRELHLWERLDWNTPYASGAAPHGGAIPNACGTFQQTTNPDSNHNPLHKGICYALNPGATVGILAERGVLIW